MGLQNTFRALDRNGTGALTPQEVKDGLVRMNIEIPPGLEDIFKNVDTNGTGKIDYSEFLAATLDKRLLMQKDICWEAFRVFDTNGDGKLSCAELKELLEGHVSASLDESKVQKMIAEVDATGDGCINFSEFCAMLLDSPDMTATASTDSTVLPSMKRKASESPDNGAPSKA